jgi:hypothetical protein
MMAALQTLSTLCQFDNCRKATIDCGFVHSLLCLMQNV